MNYYETIWGDFAVVEDTLEVTVILNITRSIHHSHY